MTLISGSILSYSTSLPVIYQFMSLSMLPLIAKTFWMQEALFNALGLMLVVAFLVLARLIPGQNKLLVENIALRIENEHQSLTDPLTKLGNRRRLYLLIETLVPSSLRRKDPFSIVLVDIDNFKLFNDEFGHSAGDDLLVQVSDLLKDCSRDQDLVVRYGAEDFLLVLPSTSLESAQILVDRIRSAMKAKTSVTFSGGIAMHSERVIRATNRKGRPMPSCGEDRRKGPLRTRLVLTSPLLTNYLQCNCQDSVALPPFPI